MIKFDLLSTEEYLLSDTPTNLKQRFNVDTIEAVFIKAEEVCQS